jgi:hypothetical protein
MGVDLGSEYALQIHAAKLSRNPQQWMPWNYRNTL